jgi:eukaryotic-like serine/threonine-protein kinase
MAKQLALLTPPRFSHSEPPERSLTRLSTAGVFVGREQEMAILRARLEDTLAGRGRLVLLVGDAGIGKTRITHELATDALARGAQVFIGRCYEGEGAPPFWPWVQIVRAYLQDCDLETLQADMGTGVVDIAQIMPEVQERLPHLPLSPSLESKHGRFRFFDSFTSFVKNVAHSQPLVLLIDDLHWADASSLLLLQFLVQELRTAPLLVIGAYRDVTLELHHPLRQTLGELGRAQESQTIALRGLTESDTATFIHNTTGSAPDATLLAAVHQQTEGNPFFLTEVVRLLANDGQLPHTSISQPASTLPIPRRVYDVISRRLTSLSADCLRVLKLASVVGRGFTLDVLTRASGLPTAHTLQVLEEALVARIIADDQQTIGSYSFSHALIREALYKELTLTQRVTFHRQVGEALETLYSADLTPHLTAMAYHFAIAAHSGTDAEKARRYATQAGARAMALLAYDEAVGHYERAAQLLAVSGADAARQCEGLLTLGDSRRRAGQSTKAKETFLQAAEIARTLGARIGTQQVAPLLARAALGMATGVGGIAVTAGVVEPSVVDLLEEALQALGEEDSALKAKVLGRLALELYWLPTAEERRVTLSQQAVEMARRVGDTAALAYTLNARHLVLWGPENVTHRLQDAAEVIQLAQATNDQEMALRGHIWRITDLVELGDLQATDREIAIYAQHAEQLKQPFYLWFFTAWKAMRAGLEGRFAEAEHLAHQALAIGQRAQDSDAAQGFTAQILAFRGGRGLKAIEASTRELVEQYRTIPAWRAALALIYADAGLKDEARQEFEYFAAHDFTNLRRDREWLGTIASLAQVCAFLRDAPRAATLYQLLLPYADRYVVFGPALVCLGSAARFLGLLATTMKRWEEAQEHFHVALQSNTRIGARPLVALTELMYAFMFLARKQPGDLQQALALVQQALVTAQELGMNALVDQVLALATKFQGANPDVKNETSATQAEIGLRLVPPQTSVIMPPQGNRPISLASPIVSAPEPVVRTEASQLSVASEQPPTMTSLFRQNGDYWIISYQESVFRLKHIRGLSYIAHLLGHPNSEFHALDLMMSVHKTSPVSASALGGALVEPGMQTAQLGEADALLDPQARAAYKQRLVELREELEEARSFNDLGRADKAQQEIDFLSSELARGLGLGGRSRSAPSSAERARINIVKGIKAAFAKIADHSPLLEHYLATTIKTGVFCSYVPHPFNPISWEL